VDEVIVMSPAGAEAGGSGESVEFFRDMGMSAGAGPVGQASGMRAPPLMMGARRSSAIFARTLLRLTFSSFVSARMASVQGAGFSRMAKRGGGGPNSRLRSLKMYLRLTMPRACKSAIMVSMSSICGPGR